MKQKHTKYTQINTNKSTQSEMGPVWRNPIQCHTECTLQVTAALVSVVGLPDLSIMSTVYTTTLPFSMTWSCSGETSMDTGAPGRQQNCNRNTDVYGLGRHTGKVRKYRNLFFIF